MVIHLLQTFSKSSTMTNTIPQELETLNVKQVMAILQCDRTTLWRWAQNKVLTPIRVGNKVLYNKETINNILNPKI